MSSRRATQSRISAYDACCGAICTPTRSGRSVTCPQPRRLQRQAPAEEQPHEEEDDQRDDDGQDDPEPPQVEALVDGRRSASGSSSGSARSVGLDDGEGLDVGVGWAWASGSGVSDGRVNVGRAPVRRGRARRRRDAAPATRTMTEVDVDDPRSTAMYVAGIRQCRLRAAADGIDAIAASYCDGRRRRTSCRTARRSRNAYRPRQCRRVVASPPVFASPSRSDRESMSGDALRRT